MENSKQTTIIGLFIGITGAICLIAGYGWGQSNAQKKAQINLEEAISVMSDGYEMVQKSLETCSRMCPHYRAYVYYK